MAVTERTAATRVFRQVRMTQATGAARMAVGFAAGTAVPLLSRVVLTDEPERGPHAPGS